MGREFIPFLLKADDNKQISYKGLVEALIEREFYILDHDEDSLDKRIDLIAKNLGFDFNDSTSSENDYLKLLRNIISGVTSLTVQILPEEEPIILEGYPMTPDFQAYAQVRSEMKEEYDSVKASLKAINEMYLTHLIYFSIPKANRARTFPISKFWADGLPEIEPASHEESY